VRASVAELLPGLIFAKLGQTYPRSEVSPIASLPAAFRTKDPSLLRQAHYKLLGERSSVYVGDFVAGVSVTAPYEGWTSFRERITAALSVLRESGLIARVERASMKATNIIEGEIGNQLSKLNVAVRIADRPPQEAGFTLRFEQHNGRLIRVVQVTPNAQLTVLPTGETWQGLLLAIDCIHNVENGRFWEDSLDLLQSLHDERNRVFFELITDDTLRELSPEYPPE
jgi:uncharacterized protein (TIGR04255 family)